MVVQESPKLLVKVRSLELLPILIVGNLVKMFVKLQGVRVCRFIYYKDTFNRWICCNSNIAAEVGNLQRQLNVLIIYAHKNIILLVAIIDALCERIISYARCRDIFSLYEKFQIMLLVVNLRNQGITRVYSTSSQRLKCENKTNIDIPKW